MTSRGTNDRPRYFDPQIPGLGRLLYQAEGNSAARGLCYYASGGLNIVLYGPPGVGKTVMALQMAIAAAFPDREEEGIGPWERGRKVIYLTKDTSAEVLMGRLEDSFRFFLDVGASVGDRAIDTARELHRRCYLLDELSRELAQWRTAGRRAGDPPRAAFPMDNLTVGGFLCFGGFSTNPSAVSCSDRYAMTESVFHALGHLAPKYSDVFDAMRCHTDADTGEPTDDERGWEEDLLVVCDSLSPEALEEHLRMQESYNRHRTRRYGTSRPTHAQPIFLFVMESMELPRSMSVAFPPDVQIRFGVRDEGHGFSTNVVQLLKTRFQKSIKQETPFVIVGAGDSALVASERKIQTVLPGSPVKANASVTRFAPKITDGNPQLSGNPTVFSERRAGINIMPPLSGDEQAPRDGVSDRELMHVRFGIERLDAMTEEGNLAGGGCTLLITQNRCGSTALSLHYLLAQIGERVAFLHRAKQLFGEWFLNPSKPEDDYDSEVLRAVWASWHGFRKLLWHGGEERGELISAFGPDIRAQTERDPQDDMKPLKHLVQLIVGLLPPTHASKADELAKELIVTLRHPHRKRVVPGNPGRGDDDNVLTQEMVRTCYWHLAYRLDEQLRLGLSGLRETHPALYRNSLRPMLATGAGTPKSVLYVSFSGDVLDLLHTVWRHPLLRQAITGPACEGKVDEAWSQMCYELEKDAQRSSSCAHRLYRVPLFHMFHDNDLFPKPTTCKGGACEQTPYLYIYVPDFSWVTIEEAVDRMIQLLCFERHCRREVSHNDCLRCLQVDRVVIDRVGRVASRWPLVGTQETFISRIASLCAQHSVELMVVDDTADTESSVGLYRSQWTSIAQNIIRLRRMPFHGSEALTVEMIRASGRLIAMKRLQEIQFPKGLSEYDDSMAVRDSFRGFTGLSVGKPQRCVLKVDLSYDLERTPLHRDMVTMRRNLENTMDAVSVRVMGPEEWSGINSAFNNLSDASRDTCHVVSIDGVWLQRLLEMDVLARLTEEEIAEVCPQHVRKAIWGDEQEPGFARRLSSKEIAERLDEQYVTRSVTIAMEKLYRQRTDDGGSDGASTIDGFCYAVPMRHNWGVLAIAQPSRDYMAYVFQTLLPKALAGTNGVPERDGTNAILRLIDLGTDAERTLQRTRQTDGVGTSLPESRGTTNGAGTPGSSSAPRVRTTDERRYAVEAVLAFLQGDKRWIDDNHGRFGEERSVLLRVVYGALWGEKTDTPITWEDLADFRTVFWHPFWQGGWIEKALTSLTNQDDTKSVPWVYLFPRIDLFDLTMTTEESVVAFFLELLLGQVEWDILFERTGKEKSELLLRFSQGVGTQEGIANTLLLMYRLLSSTQRRQIGIGVRTGHDEIGVLRRNAEVGFGEDSSFVDWPSSIALFSRQWVTSIQDLLPRYDIRQEIRLATLPASRRLARCDPAATGPTVAGTWYLGILRGGNADLGTDVMKEILSEEHELGRMLRRSGAPVTRRFYTEDFVSGRSLSLNRMLPYAAQVGGRPESMRAQEPNGAVSAGLYPFYRTRIVEYPVVSTILYDLIREVMALPLSDEASIYSELGRGARELVRGTLKRLAKVQGPDAN